MATVSGPPEFTADDRDTLVARFFGARERRGRGGRGTARVFFWVVFLADKYIQVAKWLRKSTP